MQVVGGTVVLPQYLFVEKIAVSFEDEQVHFPVEAQWQVPWSNCSFDHGHSTVAHHGGRCTCFAVLQFSSSHVEETVKLPRLHSLWFSSCVAAHHRVDELMGEFFWALHTGAGPGVVSTGTVQCSFSGS